MLEGCTTGIANPLSSSEKKKKVYVIFYSTVNLDIGLSRFVIEKPFLNCFFNEDSTFIRVPYRSLCPSVSNPSSLYPYSALKYVDPPLKKVLGRVIIFVDVQCGPTTTFLSTVPSWGSVVLLLPASPKYYSLYLSF